MRTAELELTTTSAATLSPSTTMKALVYHGPGKREWEDKPLPTIQDLLYDTLLPVLSSPDRNW